MNQAASHIQFAILSRGLFLSFPGRATHHECTTANQLVREYLAGDVSDCDVTLDLRGCQFVDSTFAGWMIGLRHLLKPRGGSVRISGCSDRCYTTLDKLGLVSLFEFSQGPSPLDLNDMTCVGGEKSDRATLELMIEAHERLAAVNPANAEVFRTVVEMLRCQAAKLGQSG